MTIRSPFAGARESRGIPSCLSIGIICRVICAMVFLGLTTLSTTLLTTLSAQVGIDDPILRSVEGIEIVEHLDTQIPLDLSFQNEIGQYVKLSEYFDGERPVVLNLAYFSCPVLCNAVVEGLIETIDAIGWTLGDEFRVVTISIDPRDTPQGARDRKEVLVRDYDRPDAIDGWHILTGHKTNIRAVADAAGFGYEWNEYRQEYAHGAVLILLTPDGRVSRYIYGVKFDPKVVRLSLVEASDGKVGSSFDKLFLLCFHYDPSTAQYGPMAQGIMKLGGLATMLALIVGFFVLQRARRRSSKSGESVTTPSDSDPLAAPPGAAMNRS
jgi:protein SCO1/2